LHPRAPVGACRMVTAGRWPGPLCRTTDPPRRISASRPARTAGGPDRYFVPLTIPMVSASRPARTLSRHPSSQAHVQQSDSLAVGRWPLAVGRWPLAAGRWPPAAGRRPPADSPSPQKASVAPLALTSGAASRRLRRTRDSPHPPHHHPLKPPPTLKHHQSSRPAPPR
jgi:hypothetical protein